ncbi:hypothetical protein N7455_009083 [Penicillium solitum]|uniref:uncharacterized protein n=1 Tax=Penicillium solitum TaxID=60172 RepID=UPI0018049E31|nr:hypothetical protein HAV15_004993 [Penicillium sp. str. \
MSKCPDYLRLPFGNARETGIQYLWQFQIIVPRQSSMQGLGPFYPSKPSRRGNVDWLIGLRANSHWWRPASAAPYLSTTFSGPLRLDHPMIPDVNVHA